ncbi:flippase-like domain-containing protein [Rhodospirillaceae bacterium KN72]|uniref:Flippase-like domain-containing protein n=1 Tax=Pacificispira spongiicola TaxID=2729598 RepID=A0A7Y0DX24_9PROT|nr:flippase-like domain-containing protein [Pacificispira spongiicola]
MTVGLFVLIARKIDFADIGERLIAADILLLTLAVGIIFLQVVLNAERWRRLLFLDGVRAPYAISFRYYLEAMFFNQALPGAVGGDVLRVYRIRRWCDGLGQAVNSVILDRLTGLFSLCVLIALGLPLLVSRIGDTGLIPALAMIAGLGGIGLVGLVLIARMSENGRGGKLRGAIIRFARMADRMIRRPSQSIPILALAVLTQVLSVTVAYISARGLSLEVSFTDCLIVIPTTILVATLPVSLGGWGVREGAMASGFALIGLDPTGGVALSVVLGLQLVVVGLIGGAVWLLGGAVRVSEEAEAEAEAAVFREGE